jgi:hypothetical protein
MFDNINGPRWERHFSGLIAARPLTAEMWGFFDPHLYLCHLHNNIRELGFKPVFLPLRMERDVC